MAPSNEDNDRKRTSDDAANPFISFRRFADEQMSNLMHNVFGPSPSSSPERRMQDYQIWLREARESRDRLNRETEEADRIMDLYTKAHKEGQDPAQEEIQRVLQGDTEGIRCPYRPSDEDTPFGTPGRTPWDRERSQVSGLGSPFQYGGRKASASSPLGSYLDGIPITYLFHSPYSPVQLEQQEALRNRGIDWREAFEDLVATQKGEEMPSEAIHRPAESSDDWVRGMLRISTAERKQTKQEEEEALEALRGKTAEVIKELPNLCFVFCDPEKAEKEAAEDDYADNFEQHDEEGEEEEEALTELDVYGRFLGKEQPPSTVAKATARSFAHLQHDSIQAELDGKKPSILSTLTTTERTTLQDGTVHTKTVLKKRFSDGREVETETIHTQNALPQGYSPQPSHTHGGNQSGERQEQKSKGWFWS